MRLQDFAAVGRLKDCIGRSRYKVSFRGDGLKNLKLPSRLALYRPPLPASCASGISKISASPLTEEHILERDAVALLRIWAMGQEKACVELEVLKAAAASALAEPRGAKGLWLCREISELAKETQGSSSAAFFFQILGARILSQGKEVGRVVDYFETGGAWRDSCKRSGGRGSHAALCRGTRQASLTRAGAS